MSQPASEMYAATNGNAKGHSAAAIDTMVFDSSLSFLDNLDDSLVGDLHTALDEQLVPTLISPLPSTENDDAATARLLDDMLSLTGGDGGSDDVKVALDQLLGDAPAAIPTTKVAPSEAAEQKQPHPTKVASPPGRLPRTPTTIPASPPAPMKTARTRQKEEMEYLRAQVVELEAELEKIKQPTSSSTSSCSSPGGSESSDGDATTVMVKSEQQQQTTLWEKIAKRQHDERHRVQVENARLRELMEGQLRIARSLEKLLRKRSATPSDSLFVENKRRCVAQIDGFSDAVFDEIRSRLALQFDDVDQVMHECGLANATCDVDDVQAKCDDHTNSIFMEMGMVKVLPFPLESVGEVVWQCTSANRIELHNGYYGASQRSDTLCNLEFAVKLQLRRSEATIHIKGVGCRRHEPKKNRSMIVFESIGVTEGSLFAGQHITCHEKGYILMEKGQDTSDGSPSTVIRTCVRMAPEMDGAASEEDAHVPFPQAGRFVDLVVGSYNQNTKTMMQVIENALLLEHTRR